MSIFDDQRETNLRACAEMVEAVIGALGHDVGGSRAVAESGLSWALKAGSAQVFIYLDSSDEGDNFIQVISPVVRPGEDVDGLYGHLLELNATSLTGAAFGLRDGTVVITTDRSTSGLDNVEVEEMIRRVSEYADVYDDILTVQYGGTRWSDLPEEERF